MGHESTSGAGFAESQDYKLRMVELYANIALTDVFVSGAAINSSGLLVYPFSDSEHLASKQQELFRNGHIVPATAGEALGKTEWPSNPNPTFLIPPRSLEKLVFERHFRGDRELQPSVSLYHGIDENNKPIVDLVTQNHRLMDYLRNLVLESLEKRGVDTKGLKDAPKTIAKKALFDMANEFGLGSLDQQVKKAIAQKEIDNHELISEVEKFLNGDK